MNDDKLIEAVARAIYDVDPLRTTFTEAVVPFEMVGGTARKQAEAALRAVREFEAQAKCDATPCPSCPEHEVCGGRIDLPQPPQEGK
jgi:hypothetical protein